jgi:hypothetical protein
MAFDGENSIIPSFFLTDSITVLSAKVSVYSYYSNACETGLGCLQVAQDGRVRSGCVGLQDSGNFSIDTTHCRGNAIGRLSYELERRFFWSVVVSFSVIHIMFVPVRRNEATTANGLYPSF